MDSVFAFIALAIVAVIAFAIARFVLKLAGRIVGCTVTAIVAIGILIILWIFFF